MKRPHSKRAIIAELKELMECEILSYAEHDGVVRDTRAIRTISKLEDAIALIRQCSCNKPTSEQSK